MHSGYFLLAFAALRGGIALANIAEINSSQPLVGCRFCGHEFAATPLGPKYPYNPPTSLMHQDGGNTGASDYPGPLGRNTTLRSYASGIRIMLWGSDGSLTAGMTSQAANGSIIYSIAALNPDTLEVQASWSPHTASQNLGLAYMSLNQATNQIVLPTKSGLMYILERAVNPPSVTLVRTIDLRNIVKPGEILFNSMFDAAGNIWFTTGSLRTQEGFPNAPGDPATNSSTIGYVESGNASVIHAMHLSGQLVENGISVSETSIFCVTGPVTSGDSTGYLFSFSSGEVGTADVVINWKAPYDAGTKRKPGAYARGSGSTPALMGDQYIAITDNSDSQIHLLIFKQNGGENDDKEACSVPIFPAGRGNNDNAVLVHRERGPGPQAGGTHGVIILNNYNATERYDGNPANLNGSWNNRLGMAREMLRVDVSEDAKRCSVRWDVPIRIQSVPVISTNTGLIYGYIQDEGLLKRPNPLYEWYVVAVDWRTGKEAFRIRTGTGGSFNDNAEEGALGPDGSFYQGVWGGLVRVKDNLIYIPA